MSDHLIDRPARLARCHGCGQHVLAAVDSGLASAADPQAISLTAEIAARLAGKAAYDIVTTGTRAYLAYRGIFRVRADRVYPVVADHECARGARPRYQLISPKQPVKKKAPGRKAARVVEERCPF